MYKKILVFGLLSLLLMSSVIAYSFPQNNVIKPTFLQKLLPFLNNKQGTWQCTGPCTYNGVDVSNDYNCVPDPIQTIPENGFDDFTGETPQCICVKKLSGACNWYDAGFGQEQFDNYQCGGSCPVGSTCGIAHQDAVEKKDCVCKTDNDVSQCGFKQVPSFFQNPTKKTCSGNCPSGQECQIVDNILQPDDCECVTPEIQRKPCSVIIPTNWQDCYIQGECTDGLSSCVYLPESNSCGCLNDNSCGLHLRIDEYSRMTYQQALQQYDDDCYGGCLIRLIGGNVGRQTSTKCEVYDEHKAIQSLKCGCHDVTTTDDDDEDDAPFINPNLQPPITTKTPVPISGVGTPTLPPVVVKDIPQEVPTSLVNPVRVIPPEPTPWYDRFKR